MKGATPHKHFPRSRVEAAPPPQSWFSAAPPQSSPRLVFFFFFPEVYVDVFFAGFKVVVVDWLPPSPEYLLLISFCISRDFALITPRMKRLCSLAFNK